ncbi:MAG TPA: LON peptidase substrate-binding domain-containing protein [Bryobacteraceae bacterium]|nr:LON peptidase substrate-binding domain-containing protein [Bryobacteraceae bacterium]
MQDTLLPLFPLEVVLLPTNVLPLHIFEDRYKEMIGEAKRSQTEFGIVQAGEKGILNIGCTATVEKVVQEYPDGRMDIVCLGRRRFEIVHLDDTKAYLRASVNFFDDVANQPRAPHNARILALACFELHRKHEGTERDTPDPDDPELSFKVVQHIADLGFRQTLLAMRSEAERLAHINQFYPQYLANLKRASHVKKVAPTNGHGFIALGKKDT